MITRPALRYFGGKWKLAPWIISHFPPHRVYVEPFGGGASVLLRKPRSYAEVYNDLDGEIVNVFRVLRNPSHARELVRLLQLTPFARDEFELSAIMADDPIEQARRTILRSFAGFSTNGLNGTTGFRANSNRNGTTAAHDFQHYPDSIALFTKRLQGVVIENRNAENIILQHDSPETLYYIDPPYVHTTRSNSCQHQYAHEMTDAQHRSLGELLKSISGKVIISGYPSDLYSDIYKDFHQVQRTHYADQARKRTEVLWMNFSPPLRLF